MKFNKVLVVAAHPDDEVLGVGGTIPLIKQNGGEVTVVIVTEGSSVQYESDYEMLNHKSCVARDANDIMGTDEIIQWNFPDMQLDKVEHYKLNQAFESLIKEKKFDTVFVNDSNDINMDHQMIYKSVSVATRPMPGQSVKHFLAYYVNSSTEWGGITDGTVFSPNFFVDISSTINIKLQAMEKYINELREYPHPRSLKAIQVQSAYFGSQVGYDYIEPFRLIFYRGNI